MKKILLVAVAVVVAGGCRGDGLLSPNVLTYSATTRLAPYPYTRDAPLSVETSVLIRNATDRIITFNYSRDICNGLELHAFATPSMSGAPVWSTPTNLICSTIGYGASSLNAGDSIQVVTYDLVTGILGTSLPSGTYYFDVVQHIGGGDIRETPVHIPAGSVTLAR